MPHAITGYAGGTLRQLVAQDDGQVTGDGLVTGWLAENPPPEPGIEALTLHIGKLLVDVRAMPLADPAPPPPPPAPPPPPPAPPDPEPDAEPSHPSGRRRSP